jgi:hypothetical protein
MGLGDSGLLRALSSQLDFVGLHLLDGEGSAAFEGLLGGGVLVLVDDSFSSSVFATDIEVWVRGIWRGGLTELSLFVDIVIPLRIELEVPGRSWVYVALLWLDVGLEFGCGEFSLLKLLGFDSLAAMTEPRLLATESALLRPAGDWTLHLLFTLSDRFIIALCTNPPMPLVGDIGRSTLSGEIRPCVGDIAKPRLSEWVSAGGSRICAGVKGIGEPKPLESFGLSLYVALAPLPYTALVLENVDGVCADSSNLSGSDDCRDIPGICILVEEFDPWSDLSSFSTWFFLYAGEFNPLSAVCLNHAGSLDARDCAICSRESMGSDEGSGVDLGDRAAFSTATIDNGLLLGRSDDCESGRLCQDRGEFREGIAADGEVLEIFRIWSDSGETRSELYSNEFSFTGDEFPINLSIVSSIATSRGRSAPIEGAVVGDTACANETREALEIVGVPTGEDFVGDIDLARSVGQSVS